jgi:hypothetical protein
VVVTFEPTVEAVSAGGVRCDEAACLVGDGKDRGKQPAPV